MVEIKDRYSDTATIVLHSGDCMELLKQIPDGKAMLVVTSPPYNIGKPYEKPLLMPEYLEWQAAVIAECVRILNKDGSICWQIGNYINDREIFPLDMLLYDQFKKHGLKLKNRIIWHFRAGQHGFKKFSPRYETILWFTRGDNYTFNLDPVRVPRRWPANTRKTGPLKGQPYGSPLGKNPGDVWIMSKVGHGHPEKTEHPCQFPVGLVERLILSLTNPGDLVVDPFIGSGTTAVAALLHRRRCAGADKMEKYLEIARQRILQASDGTLKYISYLQPESIRLKKAA